jgi:hypothetical protein
VLLIIHRESLILTIADRAAIRAALRWPLPLVLRSVYRVSMLNALPLVFCAVPPCRCESHSSRAQRRFAALSPLAADRRPQTSFLVRVCISTLMAITEVLIMTKDTRIIEELAQGCGSFAASAS